MTGSGGFERMRELSINVQADSQAVQDTNVVLMNADKKITGTGTTDSSGDANGILFRTMRVDSTGPTNDDLSGYEAVTVAEIDYTSTKGDFRYAFETLSLNDASGNAGSIVLTDRINARVCYSFSSASYEMVSNCAGSLSTGGNRILALLKWAKKLPVLLSRPAVVKSSTRHRSTVLSAGGQCRIRMPLRR